MNLDAVKTEITTCLGVNLEGLRPDVLKVAVDLAIGRVPEDLWTSALQEVSEQVGDKVRLKS